MATSEKLRETFQRFDEANRQDPNKEDFQGNTYPKELLYAIRMTQKLDDFAPNASEALKLTARCQHICRWQIPRESFEMNREGYLRWRQELKKFHVQKATAILRDVGYEEDMIAKVSFLLEKKQLKKNQDTQTLEDVICLVFLEHYFGPFSTEHLEAKIIDILQKTWRKMSKTAKEAALRLTLTHHSRELVSKAIKR